MDSWKLQNPDSNGIRTMFDRLAERYDLFNHLTSLGLATGWRRRALRPLKAGMRVLDLGCGTGDLALEAAERMHGTAEIVGLDFAPEMLRVAERRADKMGLKGFPERPRFVQGKAEDLPFEKEPYDLVVSGFVLRNLYQNIVPILSAVRRSLKPGGTIRFMDFTEPPNPVFRALWRFYMNRIVYLYGIAIWGKDYPTHYLTESAKRFLKPADFIRELERAGFAGARVETFLLGTIALYTAENASLS